MNFGNIGSINLNIDQRNADEMFGANLATRVLDETRGRTTTAFENPSPPEEFEDAYVTGSESGVHRPPSWEREEEEDSGYLRWASTNASQTTSVASLPIGSGSRTVNDNEAEGFIKDVVDLQLTRGCKLSLSNMRTHTEEDYNKSVLDWNKFYSVSAEVLSHSKLGIMPNISEAQNLLAKLQSNKIIGPKGEVIQTLSADGLSDNNVLGRFKLGDQRLKKIEWVLRLVRELKTYNSNVRKCFGDIHPKVDNPEKELFFNWHTQFLLPSDAPWSLKRLFSDGSENSVEDKEYWKREMRRYQETYGTPKAETVPAMPDDVANELQGLSM